MSNSAVTTARADTCYLQPTVDEADANTLLDQLAAIARRSVKADGLPPDMADKLQALAEAARTHGPVIEHPAWCDRGEGCRRVDENSGLVSIYHEATLFEATEGDTQFNPGGTWRVQLLLAENYDTDGTIDREAVGLYIDMPAYSDGLRGVMLERFTRAVALAGHLAAQSPPATPDRCGCDSCEPAYVVVPRRVFGFIGDPNGPAARGYANPD